MVPTYQLLIFMFLSVCLCFLINHETFMCRDPFNDVGYYCNEMVSADIWCLLVYHMIW